MGTLALAISLQQLPGSEKVKHYSPALQQVPGVDKLKQHSLGHIVKGISRWYTVLNVAPTASPKVVKQAFRDLARLHHPDKGGDAAIFKMIRQAYDQGILRSQIA